MEEKIEESWNKIRKNCKKALGVLDCICSVLQIPMNKKFSSFKDKSIDDLTEMQTLKLTQELKEEITKLLEEHFLQKWITITNQSYEGNELDNMKESIHLMIKIEPINSYDYFMTLFNILEGLNSEDEIVVMNTLFMIRESASKLSTEEIINSYGELVRSKYRDVIIYSILDGAKKNKKKKNTEYIATYFNDKKQPGSDE